MTQFTTLNAGIIHSKHSGNLIKIHSFIIRPLKILLKQDF